MPIRRLNSGVAKHFVPESNLLSVIFRASNQAKIIFFPQVEKEIQSRICSAPARPNMERFIADITNAEGREVSEGEAKTNAQLAEVFNEYLMDVSPKVAHRTPEKKVQLSFFPSFFVAFTTFISMFRGSCGYPHQNGTAVFPTLPPSLNSTTAIDSTTLAAEIIQEPRQYPAHICPQIFYGLRNKDKVHVHLNKYLFTSKNDGGIYLMESEEGYEHGRYPCISVPGNRSLSISKPIDVLDVSDVGQAWLCLAVPNGFASKGSDPMKNDYIQQIEKCTIIDTSKSTGEDEGQEISLQHDTRADLCVMRMPLGSSISSSTFEAKLVTVDPISKIRESLTVSFSLNPIPVNIIGIFFPDSIYNTGFADRLYLGSEVIQYVHADNYNYLNTHNKGCIIGRKGEFASLIYRDHFHTDSNKQKRLSSCIFKDMKGNNITSNPKTHQSYMLERYFCLFCGTKEGSYSMFPTESPNTEIQFHLHDIKPPHLSSWGVTRNYQLGLSLPGKRKGEKVSYGQTFLDKKVPYNRCPARSNRSCSPSGNKTATPAMTGEGLSTVHPDDATDNQQTEKPGVGIGVSAAAVGATIVAGTLIVCARSRYGRQSQIHNGSRDTFKETWV